MSYALQDQLSLSIHFSGVEFPLNHTNFVSSLHIKESVKLFLPELVLELYDGMRILSSLGLQDGMPVTITFSKNGTIVQTIPFRVFSSHASQTAEATFYHIEGYFACPKYLFSAAPISLKGTSTEALKQIASVCGLLPAMQNTNDYQLWTPPISASYAVFASYITKRGFANNFSCMQSGISTRGIFIYRDIMASKPDGVIYTKQQKVSKELNARDHVAISFDVNQVMGLNNATGGYSTYIVPQPIHKALDTVKEVSVKSNVKAPLINTTIKKAIGRQKYIHLPIDAGNAHDLTANALNQNKRLAKLFTSNLEVVIHEPTAYTLCDSFMLSAVEDNGEPNYTDSGTYTITDRIIYIDRGHYYEKLLACRIGTNHDYIAV